jgi:hypothetical protein
VFRRTCSWCHTENVIDGPTRCRSCGHRADLPRMDCDCDFCQPGIHDQIDAVEAAPVADDQPDEEARNPNP